MGSYFGSILAKFWGEFFKKQKLVHFILHTF